MRSRRKSILGIEVHEREVRIVESRIGAVPVVVGVASAPIPAGAVERGAIVRSDAVALAIRRAVESMGAQGTEAVLGVPTAGCLTRSFTVPTAPDDELQRIVEAEVLHFQLLQSEDGAFDFFTLQDASKANETSIALMAAEGVVNSSLRETAQRAGLQVLAIEPVSIGVMRAVHPLVADLAATMIVTVTETATELTVSRNGYPSLHRRVDVGATALFATGLMAHDESDAPAAAPVMQPGPLETLAVEVRRTVEFVQRQTDGAEAIELLVLASNCVGVEPLAEVLFDSVGIPVKTASLAGSNAASAEASEILGAADGARFIAAVGLSRHAPESSPPGIPLLDLFVHERSAIAEMGQQRSLTGALLFGLVIIAAGIAGGFFLGQSNSKVQDAVVRLKADKAALLKAQSENQVAASRRLNEIAQLQSNSVPIGAIVDHLGSSLDSGTGIDEVSVNPQMEMTIAGEATDEASLLATVQRLQQRGVFGIVSIASFDKLQDQIPATSIKFQLRSKFQENRP